MSIPTILNTSLLTYIVLTYGLGIGLLLQPTWTLNGLGMLVLGRLIDHIQSFEGVWLTTCGAIAEHHIAIQAAVAEEVT